MNSFGPATLKSMSPKKSSTPWMSVRVVYLPFSYTRPIAMPETGAWIGTPPSMSASEVAQTDPIEVEPLELSTSETMRIAYGHSSVSGSIGTMARSARAPWPISRRFGEPTRPASPVE